MNCRFFVALLLIVLCSIGFGKEKVSKSQNKKVFGHVDTLFVIPVTDIDFDGSNDTLFLRITGKTLTAPFTLHCAVRNKKKSLYTISYHDTVVEKMFFESDSIEFCHESEYQICKKKWYFDILPKTVTLISVPSDTRRATFFDTLDERALPVLLQKTFKDILHFDEQRASQQATKILRLMQTHDLTFFVLPPNPFHPISPSVYNPGTKTMVRIFMF